MGFQSLDSTIFFLLATSFSLQAIAAADPDPLFAVHDALTVRIAAPFAQIMAERPHDDDEEVPGTFTLIDADGAEQSFAVRIMTRGNNRRDPNVCPFAPLRLNFKKGDLDDTVLAGQDKLKLVTHCIEGRKPYQQTVLREYLAYRVLNLLTDLSFRVRFLQISYAFTDDDKAESTVAFFIESKQRLARRTGMLVQDIPETSVLALDREYLNLISVYAYLIGNVDFSPIQGKPGEPCCHNSTLFSRDGETYWSIPYDFDMTGFVEPAHVRLNPKYRQSSIRQRVYRGRCVNNDLLPATLQKFRDQRTAIEAVIASQPGLQSRQRKRMESYVESFYSELDDEEKLIRSFEKACID